ncbi:MAG: 50S ribosomal protein L4 [Candidatus Magasanikbacteria bacterium RIFCSPHIGHO2_02_FULL_51_14]|uniref:Large ribosomal subunit protein uL4 n=1 Tax=Candidatus Magasanikbacteria bacterium RIFCSPHIGHO2_02_FULL_51_14 TaxID=1798683 RepID=A0A1F6MHL4_9BACT|nr:MAG: 50S ribosomal protein L4 [Candidatus Magasanikbacteria bacterium RIFCSPHIGHO2_02_FULL_51_14]
MPKAVLYNVQGEKTGDIELNDAVFGVKPKKSVVHQVYTALLANAREPWAHTKDKGDVRGGGKKPWRQKGTGRARHGSIRSPIWRGGGITFGPLNIRNYKQKINKKMNRLAMRMCLSDKAAETRFLVLEEAPLDGKTKTLAALWMKLPGYGKSTLLVTHDGSPMVERATRSLQRLHVRRAQDVNVLDALGHQYVITTKAGVAALEKRLTARA